MLLRGLVFVSVTALALVPLSAPAATTVAIVGSSAQAPMDRYFGKLAMSPLGIGNSINLVNDRVASKELDSAHAVLALAFVEDAVKDWEAKFPKDRWLPRTIMALKRSYRAFGDATGRDNERRMDTWLLLHYPQSTEARSVIALAASDAVKVASATR